MNHWAKETLNLVKKQNYLDQLQLIYSHEDGDRSIEDKKIKKIITAFNDADSLTLINELLSLEKFPYKDSYAAFLRKDRSSLQRNPETVDRIFKRLQNMGLDEVIKGISKPKEANTRRGPQFTNWLKSQYPSRKEDQFIKAADEICLLDGSEEQQLKFCNNILKLGIVKRPDIVAKSGSKYIVGEAKFLSSLGGNQGRGFEDGISLATNSSGRAYKIFLLDGVIWLEEGSAHFQDIENSNAMIMSAILLDNFLKSLL